MSGDRLLKVSRGLLVERGNPNIADVACLNVRVDRMTDAEYEIFHELTSTSPSLDDGEAATIAIAAARHFLPVIDERRRRSRASALMKARTPGSSLDLFRHPTAIAVLGDQPAVEALYLALRDGRMRIPSESGDGVIALIGMERSRDCTCLPGYRERFVDAHYRAAAAKSADIANLANLKTPNDGAITEGNTPSPMLQAINFCLQSQTFARPRQCAGRTPPAVLSLYGLRMVTTIDGQPAR